MFRKNRWLSVAYKLKTKRFYYTHTQKKNPQNILNKTTEPEFTQISGSNWCIGYTGEKEPVK